MNRFICYQLIIWVASCTTNCQQQVTCCCMGSQCFTHRGCQNVFIQINRAKSIIYGSCSMHAIWKTLGEALWLESKDCPYEIPLFLMKIISRPSVLRMYIVSFLSWISRNLASLLIANSNDKKTWFVTIRQIWLSQHYRDGSWLYGQLLPCCLCVLCKCFSIMVTACTSTPHDVSLD